jgi:putative oxygen-independent coproporphyrinogen III oxidase
MGLYIHVPFCGSICSYCHFARTADHHSVIRSRYVDAVVQEFDLRWRACPVLRGGRPLQTTYVGGGTPSELEPELMERLLAGTVGRLRLSEDFELTCEANPESLDEEKARRWQAAGVNRISLGVQSLDSEVLSLLGRSCPPDVARKALALACETFDRVSADWIIGPGLREDTLLAELSEAVGMGVEHFSLYILELHPGTKLEHDVRLGRVQAPGDEHTELLYLAAAEHLQDYGIRQYEVSNFSRPGAESRHNRNYWRRKPWLGLGQAAHGCYGPRRYANHDTYEKYCAAVENGDFPESAVDPLSVSSRLLERMILALRTARGVPLVWLAEGCLDLEAGQKEGLWQIADGFLMLTVRGFLLIDSIEQEIRPRLSG